MGHVVAPLVSTLLDVSGASAVDEHAKAAAGGSGTGAVALAADFVLAAIPGGEEGGAALKKEAEELAEHIGSNSVSRTVEGGVERIDLVGRPHGGVETPHVHTYKLHTDPTTGASRLSRTSRIPRAATKEDLQNARKAAGVD